MKVYVVERMVETEYGGTQIEAIFSTEKQAKTYIEENQEYTSVWWKDNDVPELEYEAWEVV